MRSQHRALRGVGSASTVWSVVTTGMVRRDSSARMWPPASPPKMPNSCCRETTSKPAGVQEIRGRAVVLEIAVVDLEATAGG